MNSLDSRRFPQLASLPQRHRLVLHLCALAEPPTGKSKLLGCLTRSPLRRADGQEWTGHELATILADLEKWKLIAADHACAPQLRHRLATEAADDPVGGVLVEAVRVNLPYPARPAYYHSGHYQPNERDAAYRLLRLAIYANDEERYIAAAKQFETVCVPHKTADLILRELGSEALDPDWLADRCPPIQVDIFNTKMAILLTSGQAPPGLPAMIQRYRALAGQASFAGVGGMVMQYDLLAGDIGALRQIQARLAGSSDPASPEALCGLILEADLAFLAGETARAIEKFRLALKGFRKLRGKRRLVLNSPHGIFFILALLHAGDAALHPEIQTLIDIGLNQPDMGQFAYAPLQGLLWLAQGMEAQARETIGNRLQKTGYEPLTTACLTLLDYLVNPEDVAERCAELRGRFLAMRGALPLVARIYAEILAEIEPGAAAPGAYLAAQETISVRFTQIIHAGKPWERALDGLSAFLFTAARGTDAGIAAPRAKRLAWRLDPETLALEVIEQAARPRDGWSDGRAVSLKRLNQGDPKLDYLTAQDRAALKSIRVESYGQYGDFGYQLNPVLALPALIGHPCLFDARARSRPIELVAGGVELVVGERGRGYHVALSHTADAHLVFLEPETPTRYRVIEFAQRLLPVQALLGKQGLTVPKEGRDRLIALVQRADPALPIRAELEELAQAASPGQSHPVVQLLPQDGEVRVTLAVRPFGEAGPAYIAGLGARSVLASIGGQSLRASRDLARELTERDALVAGCPTLAARIGQDGHEAVIEDMDGCLDLLLELQVFGPQVSIEWPDGQKIQVSEISSKQVRVRVSGERDWFAVDGSIEVDSELVLDMRFLLDRLDRARGRFIRLDDGRFLALTRQLQAQLGRLAAVSEPHKDGRRVHALGAPALRDLLAEAGGGKVDAAWKKQVKKIEAAEDFSPAVPSTLQAELRDYQAEGFAWLARLARWGAGACLADDMGLGKTVQAIALLLDQADGGPSLVVAPTSVCPNWMAELARFAPTLTAQRFADAPDRAALVAGLGARDILVCSYGLLNQAAELLGGRRWQVAVLDEAQAIKNARTKRAQASHGLQADFRLAMSGTPVENYLDELWSLFNFATPGLLGSYESFQKRFATPIERDHDANARHALRALVRPFLLRRTKAAVLSELPPRTEQTLLVEMGEAERAFYEALRQQALETIAGLEGAAGTRKIHILAALTKLRRACCNPALVDKDAGVGSAKLAAFMELAEELIRNRHKALVFSQFTGHLALVRAELDARGIAYQYLDGATPPAERERQVAAFQGAGGADLFLISLRAGGTGLNLTAANYVVHLDPWWNPAVEDQASDRAHRIGQLHPVTIYRLILQGSIEARIVGLHRDKRDLARDLLEGAEASARLSEAELVALIRG